MTDLPDLPDIGFDYLEDARAALADANDQLVNTVAPGIELLLAAAQANALIAIAEALEALSYTDIPLYPTDKTDS